jgi:hypothetical protein
MTAGFVSSTKSRGLGGRDSAVTDRRYSPVVRLPPLIEWGPIVPNVHCFVVGSIAGVHWVNEDAYFSKMPIPDVALVGAISPMISNIESVSRSIGEQIVSVTILVNDVELAFVHPT